jgi:hypothetical protein
MNENGERKMSERKTYVILTLDLKDATAEEREEFYESLKDSNWEKCDNVSTVWWTEHIYMDKEEIMGEVKRDLENAAKAADEYGLLDYHVVVGLCKDKPIEFSS